MPAEKMLDEINKMIKELPDRKMQKYDESILEKYKFEINNDNKDVEIDSILDYFK